MTVLLLFWQAFGFPFSWPKGQKGPEVQWIGAALQIINSGPKGRGVLVSVPEDKTTDLGTATAEFRRRNVAGRRALRKYAGQMSFVAGLVPHLRPFLSGIWATLKQDASSAGPVAPGRMRAGAEHVVWTRQIEHSLAWIAAFLAGTAGAPLVREMYLRDTKYPSPFSVAMDASPWGIGGVILEGTRPIARFAGAVQQDDVDRFGVVVGDHRFQGIMEGIGLLVAVRLSARTCSWGSGAVASLTVKSDSKAALGSALNLASPQSAMNAIGRELAFDQATGDYQVRLYEHVWGVANKLPYFLSRLAAPGGEGRPLPTLLSGLPELDVPKRDDAWWRTWCHPT